jgi:hypothetical protein
MECTGASWLRPARPGGVAAVAAVMILAGGCTAGRSVSGGVTPAPSTTRTGSAGDVAALASRYLAIAVPANHRLDTDVDGFADERHQLAAAESELRAEVAAERWFDLRLTKIPFPAEIAAIARALVRANQSRIALTDREARSASIAGLRSFSGRHRAADAAVEVQVTLIRRALGLAPPSDS